VESSGEVRFEDGVRMGTLYDLAYQTVAVPISGFRVVWNMMAKDDKGNGEVDLELPDIDMPLRKVVAANKRKEEADYMVTMLTTYTIQCKRGMPPDVGEEFRSEGFERLDMKMEETKSLR
jgi:hypothetical protein